MAIFYIGIKSLGKNEVKNNLTVIFNGKDYSFSVLFNKKEENFINNSVNDFIYMNPLPLINKNKNYQKLVLDKIGRASCRERV